MSAPKSNIDAKSRLLYALVLDVRKSARKMRTGSSRREREAGAEEYVQAKHAAIKFIKSMLASKAKNSLDDTGLGTLAEYVLNSIMLATLPGGNILNTHAFEQSDKRETASMSDSIEISSDLLFKANRIIDLAVHGEDVHARNLF